MYRTLSARSGALRARLARAATFLLAMAAGALAACGGGGGDEGPAAPPPPPSGAQHPVGGTVTGLAGTLVLANGAGAALTVTASGSYALTLAHGEAYQIVVRTQPQGQTCVVENGSGVVAGPVTNVLVACGTASHAIGGTVSGLIGVVTLRLNGAADLQVRVNGGFRFSAPLAHGSAYAVTVREQPAEQLCTVEAGTGVAVAPVTQVQVLCRTVSEPPAPPPAPPAAPGGLSIAYGPKSLLFSWTPAPGATSYTVYEDPDGTGPLASAAIGSAASPGLTYAVPVLLHQRLNATYVVRACNAGGCSAPSPFVAADMVQAIGYFKASATTAEARFGNRLAVSGDGLTLAVGAYGEGGNTGAVYVFRKTGALWAQQARIAAPNGDANDYFGNALALSADGNTLAIGADGESGDHRGTFSTMPATNNLASNSGAVYVYSRAGAAWSLQAFVKANNGDADDLFGSSVALSSDGNTLAVAAYYEDGDLTGAKGNPAYSGSGAAYVFVRSGTRWAQQGYLKASNAGLGDFFGIYLSLSRAGDTLAVGAFFERSASGSDPADDTLADAGAAYVFQRSGGAWSQQAYLKAPQPMAQDRFGVAVQLSGDGNTLAVGMDGDSGNHTGVFVVPPARNTLATNSGAVFVFIRAGGSWQPQAYLKASNTRSPHRFGNNLAMSSDGNTLVVPSYRDDSNARGFLGNQADATAADAGAVLVFRRSGGTWVQQAYLKAPNTGAGDRFGGRVAISADGNTLAVGASTEDGGSTGVGGSQNDESRSNAGAVYLY
ncbi:FG-GAP repeat protein [Acidovorax sp. sic0104]|uniref:FG-GAP repeat protein n=1 Tax=Acidovorax sp. sic0104 TaxID=2854784 RepID=UPI001C48B5D1|nr:FG-GAP repeat protein [Acidovorax sp. sic0104]MBV7539521.1 FG-GAP repeat protein [Acidovorax sp. sic0104]